VRTFRARLYGDDLSFLQEGLPSTFVSDSSFTAFYPWYHKPTDTADKLDAAALARMGTAVVGGVEALCDLRLDREPQRDWFAAFGFVAGPAVLWVAGLAAFVPGLVGASRAGGRTLAARVAQAALGVFLMWRHLVPALWVVALPAAITGVVRRRSSFVPALVPPLLLVAVGAVGWVRGMLSGLWVGAADVAGAAAALALLFAPQPSPGAPRKRSHGSPRRAGLPGKRAGR
jgi:hypothetical protein